MRYEQDDWHGWPAMDLEGEAGEPLVLSWAQGAAIFVLGMAAGLELAWIGLLVTGRW